MYVIIMKQHGALNCEQKVYGPYADFDTAYDAMCDGRVPPLFTSEFCYDTGLERNGHRYLQELVPCKGSVESVR